jgi:hypothetical protein
MLDGALVQQVSRDQPLPITSALFDPLEIGKSDSSALKLMRSRVSRAGSRNLNRGISGVFS